VMDKPFALIDTLALTPAGYKGVDLENVLALQLLRSAKGDVKKAERGVVFFDEFDKKASTSDKESNFDKRTIDQLLTYMSGTKCTVEYNGRDTEIDTSFITFVLGGSFADMIKSMMENKETDESYKRTTIGFIKDTAKKIKDINEYDLKYPEKIEDEDLAVHGHMRPEMINRIPTKIVMQGENRISLKDILLYSTVSPLVFEEKRINAKGANLAVLEEFVDPFVESAFGRKQCGRSLKNGLFEITSLINDVLDEYPSRFKYAVLNKECVSNPRDALLIDYENNRYTVGELKDEIKKAKEGKTKESVIKTYAFIPEN
ncbi:MAG: AAA family ATPase, partial [Bacilli bacterium]|nr:AAA family ATPase [Bacilli bacterium]